MHSDEEGVNAWQQRKVVADSSMMMQKILLYIFLQIWFCSLSLDLVINFTQEVAIDCDPWNLVYFIFLWATWKTHLCFCVGWPLPLPKIERLWQLFLCQGVRSRVLSSVLDWDTCRLLEIGFVPARAGRPVLKMTIVSDSKCLMPYTSSSRGLTNCLTKSGIRNKVTARSE